MSFPTKAIPCRLEQIVGTFLCSHGRHKWELQTMTDKDEHRVFYTRTCARCHLFQIQNAGPMGDGKWILLDQAFQGIVGEWERKQFERAI